MTRHLGNLIGWRFLTGTALLLVAAPWCRAEESATEDAAAQIAVPAAQIAIWIRQLDANQFNTRESAQRGLEKAGAATLEAVGNAAVAGSLESSTRAVNILLAWSESPDHELQIAALEKLTTLENRPREAFLASELLADSREQAALAAIAEWGGISHDQQGLPFRNGRRYLQVVIDSQWKGGTEGLAVLADVRRAATVNIYFVPIDDEAIEVLRGMPNLHSLWLFGTNVSDEAVTKLKEDIPNVEVRSGAFLGVKGPSNRVAQITKIDTVVAGGAAERAGLKAGDAITELNGEPIADFTTLTQRIAKYQPGDSVELTIVRDGKPQTKTVTFQQWTIKSSVDPKLLSRINQLRRGDMPIPLPPRQSSIDRR